MSNKDIRQDPSYFIRGDNDARPAHLCVADGYKTSAAEVADDHYITIDEAAYDTGMDRSALRLLFKAYNLPTYKATGSGRHKRSARYDLDDIIEMLEELNVPPKATTYQKAFERCGYSHTTARAALRRGYVKPVLTLGAVALYTSDDVFNGVTKYMGGKNI